MIVASRRPDRPAAPARPRAAARRLGGVLVALALLAGPLAARDRIDVIQLSNGDRVTGEIIVLRSASLTVRSKEMGTVNLDWPAVTSLVSPQSFEIELADGRRLFGTPAAPGQPGVLALTTSENGVMNLPLSEVVGIVQLGRRPWNSRRGYFNVGFNFASSSGDAELSIGAQLDMKGKRLRSTTTFAATVSDDPGSEQRTRGDLDWTLEAPAGIHWALVGAGKVERNDDLGLDARLSASAAVVWIPLRSASGRVGIGGGFYESQERYRGQGQYESLPSAMFSTSGDYDRFGPFGTHLSAGVVYLSMLEGPDRYRVEVRANLRQVLFRDFTFNLAPYYSFDSQPPQVELDHEDWGLTSSIGWSY